MNNSKSIEESSGASHTNGKTLHTVQSTSSTTQSSINSLRRGRSYSSSSSKKSPRRVIFPTVYKTSSYGSSSLDHSNRSAQSQSHNYTSVRSRSSSISSSSSKHSTALDDTETILITTTSNSSSTSTINNAENPYDNAVLSIQSHSRNPVINPIKNAPKPQSAESKHHKGNVNYISNSIKTSTWNSSKSKSSPAQAPDSSSLPQLSPSFPPSIQRLERPHTRCDSSNNSKLSSNDIMAPHPTKNVKVIEYAKPCATSLPDPNCPTALTPITSSTTSTRASQTVTPMNKSDNNNKDSSTNSSMPSTTSTPSQTITPINSSDDNNKDNSTNKSMSLEKKLFHQIHKPKSKNLNIKEFKECWSFCNTCCSTLGKDTCQSIDYVIDVAGGHGALGALFLIKTSARESIVIDPANVGNGCVTSAWESFWDQSRQSLRYRYECLRTALPDELSSLVKDDTTRSSTGIDGTNAKLEGKKTDRTRILVVACHACSFLTDELLEIACNFGVHVAVMPCCQKDQTGGSMKEFGKKIGIGIGPLSDIIMAGKISSWKVGAHVNVSYEVKMKIIDSSITPQNRMIIGKVHRNSDEKDGSLKKQRETRLHLAHTKLEKAYARSHEKKDTTATTSESTKDQTNEESHTENIITNHKAIIIKGVAAGLFLYAMFLRRRK